MVHIEEVTELPCLPTNQVGGQGQNWVLGGAGVKRKWPKGFSHDCTKSGSQTMEHGFHIPPSLLKMSTGKYTHTHKGAQAHTCNTHSRGNTMPSSLLHSPQMELHQGTWTSQQSCKQMSLTFTPLPGLICPDSHLICTGNGFIHYGWCVHFADFSREIR